MKRQILYLTSAGIVAVDEAPARAPAVVVADLPDESYVPLQLPPVGWRDRGALLARHLAQHFPDTPYRLAIRLAASAPNGYTHLLAALPADPLRHLQMPGGCDGREIVGVWSVALAVAWWMRVARRPVAKGLVLVRTPAGVRHILLAGGRPVVSRLVSEELTAEAAVDHPRELQRTVQYLRNAKWLAADERVESWSWGERLDEHAPPAVRGALLWQPTPQLRGLPDPTQHGAAALFALLARRQPRTQFAPPEVLLPRRARQAALALQVCAALIAAALLALGVAEVRDGRAALAERAALGEAAVRLQRELDHARRRLRDAGVDGAALRGALAAHARLPATAVTLDHGLRVVAGALGSAASFRLDELDWGDAGNATGDAQGAGCAVEDASAHTVARLRGSTREVDWRTIAVDRERFERALRTAPGVELHAERAPLALDRAPLRRGADTPRAQPFSYCVRIAGGRR